MLIPPYYSILESITSYKNIQNITYPFLDLKELELAIACKSFVDAVRRHHESVS